MTISMLKYILAGGGVIILLCLCLLAITIIKENKDKPYDTNG